MPHDSLPKWTAYTTGTVLIHPSRPGVTHKIVGVFTVPSSTGRNAVRKFNMLSSTGKAWIATSRYLSMRGFVLAPAAQQEQGQQQQAQQQQGQQGQQQQEQAQQQQGQQQAQQQQQGEQQQAQQEQQRKAHGPDCPCPRCRMARKGQQQGQPEQQQEKRPEQQQEQQGEAKGDASWLTHPSQDALVRMLRARLNVWLVGPAASGKTTALEKAAETLGLPFYSKSVGPQTTEASLLGYKDAQGRTVRTLLRDAFEHGGVFLLDEVDAADASVLIVINSLLANDLCAFPDGMVRKNKDFVLGCGANTTGSGADRRYSGRQEQDGAILDRFVMLRWDYDPALEGVICGASPSVIAKMARPKPPAMTPRNAAETQAAVDDWYVYVNAARSVLEKMGDDEGESAARIIISPRATKHGAAMLREGFAWRAVADIALWKGCPTDLRVKITNGVKSAVGMDS